jgi:hypothetical protein
LTHPSAGDWQQGIDQLLEHRQAVLIGSGDTKRQGTIASTIRCRQQELFAMSHAGTSATTDAAFERFC